MGLLTAALFTPIIVAGVFLGSPAILGFAGLSAVGPVAGGLFAATQATGVAVTAGSWMAAAQAIAMTVIAPTP